MGFHRSHSHGGFSREDLKSVPEAGKVVHDNDVVVEEDAGINVGEEVLEEESGCCAELEPVNHLLETFRVSHLDRNQPKINDFFLRSRPT